MKRLAALAMATVALAFGSAQAADLPAKAAPRPAVAPVGCNWCGFYIGIHGGYGWKDDDFSEVISTTPLVSIGNIRAEGWVLGGHAGYNWQYGPVVGGLEIDFSSARINGSISGFAIAPPNNFSVLATRSDNVKYLGTARTRLGWAPEWTGIFGSGLLIYGTAGLAWERLERTDGGTFVLNTTGPTNTFTFTSTTPNDVFGWVAGAGVESKVFGDWILGVEYLHYDFSHTRTASASSSNNGGVITSSANTAGSQTIDVVRGRLSYKFCGGCR